MPTAIAAGISTHYEVTGEGAPLLMFSPGGFNAALENWDSFGIYARLALRANLGAQVRCIAFDRREAGTSGGRVERIDWQHYADQGRALLDELGIERAHLIGGCAGCSVALRFACAFPDRTASMILFSPAGGPRYRLAQQARFDRHLAFVADHGLAAVVELARAGTESFSSDPRVGPWAPVLRHDDEFARHYVGIDAGRYQATVAAMGRLLFDRDTVAGAEPEDLMQLDRPAFIVPGRDASHATSAARYLEECLPGAEYFDVPVPEQQADNVGAALRRFLSR